MRDLDAIFLEKRINELEKNGGNTDYEKLNNKPSINNIVLDGNKSLEDLGVTESVVNYSTDEKIVGTWLDGKKIYEKTIVDFSPVNNTGEQIEEYDLNIANVDKAIGIQPLMDSYVNQPRPAYGNNAVRYTPFVDSNKLKLYVETGADRHTIKTTFAVRYTKLD